MKIEDEIRRIGLELGFTHVGIAPVHDWPEYEAEVLSRPDYEPFTATDESLLMRIARTKTLNPDKNSIICATLGFAHVDYPEKLVKSVARAYLSRTYTPPIDTYWGQVIEDFALALEELGLDPDRNQFNTPQRLACAEAGIVTLSHNNFAYTPDDGSFIIMVTFLVSAKLEYDEPSPACDCPPGCDLCQRACPTDAILAPCRLQLDRCILFNNQRFEPGAQEEIWPEMGMRIHGCDACQLACPKNHEVLEGPKAVDPLLEELAEEFDLEKILLLDEEYYEHVVQPIMYNYIRDMDIFRRNAAVALGNSGDSSHIPALQQARELTDNEHVLKAIDYALEKLEIIEATGKKSFLKQ